MRDTIEEKTVTAGTWLAATASLFMLLSMLVRCR